MSLGESQGFFCARALIARWQKRAQKKPAEGEALKAHFVLDHPTKEGRRPAGRQAGNPGCSAQIKR